MLRSYDLKRLYHHPELDVAYGAGYLTRRDRRRCRERRGSAGAPAARFYRNGRHSHVRRCTTTTGFVSNPLWFQVRVAGRTAGRRAQAHDADLRARRPGIKERRARNLSVREGAGTGLEAVLRAAVSEPPSGTVGARPCGPLAGLLVQPWFAATVAATVAATAFDAALLHRRRSVLHRWVPVGRPHLHTAAGRGLLPRIAGLGRRGAGHPGGRRVVVLPAPAPVGEGVCRAGVRGQPASRSSSPTFSPIGWTRFSATPSTSR